MQAAPEAAANANPYGLIPALQQGGVIAISVFFILITDLDKRHLSVLCTLYGSYVISTCLIRLS